MAITYPLSLPTNFGMSNIVLSAENVSAISQSPFTFNQQVIKHAGERWTATVTLPPMKRSDAEPWISFLMSLKGNSGTFLLGDPNAVNPQGPVLKRNLYLFSEEFSNAYWTKVGVTATSTAISNPVSGLSSGVFDIVEDTSTGNHSIQRNVTNVTAGRRYTQSIYINSASTREILLLFGAGSFGVQQSVRYNATTNTFSPPFGTPTYFSTALTGGWYRVSMSALATATGTNAMHFYMSNPAVSYTGDGTSLIRIANAQLEETADVNPTVYQKTLDTYDTDFLVNGAGQTGNVLNVNRLNRSVTGILKAGDYIQLSSGAGTTLHKVLQDANSDVNGAASLDIWPSLRSSPANSGVVKSVGTLGKFRLASNVQQYEINNISSYGITFDCVEAL